MTEVSTPVALSGSALPALLARAPGPSDDRGRTGIVHFGVGGFHRAHPAMYLDRLMNDGKAPDRASARSA